METPGTNTSAIQPLKYDLNGTGSSGESEILDNSIPEEYLNPENLEILAYHLRHAVKSKPALQYNRHVDYFSGTSLLAALVDKEGSEPLKNWPKKLPKITDEGIGIAVAEAIMETSKYFHRSEKVKNKTKPVQLSRSNLNVFEKANAYYTWLPSFEGSKLWSRLGTALLMFCIIGCTLMPIWPLVLKKGIWYISVTILIVILSFCLVRTLLFTVCWAVGYEVWILPNIFDESKATFKEMYLPFIQYEASASGQMVYRLALISMLVGAGYWVQTQPTEFDTFLASINTGIDELYAGNLLSDVAANHKENLDRIHRGMPSFEQLQNEADFENGEGEGEDRLDKEERKLRSDAGRHGHGDGEELADIDMDVMDAAMDRELEDDASMAAMLEELDRLEAEEEAKTACNVKVNSNDKDSGKSKNVGKRGTENKDEDEAEDEDDDDEDDDHVGASEN